MHPFERSLRAHFGSTAPLGACLRDEHLERWLRLHSLPGSKRYAAAADEHAEVRRRARAAASAVFAPGEPVWLTTGHFDDEPRAVVELAEAPALLFDRAGTYRSEAFDGVFTAYATRVLWPHPELDVLVDAIAQERLRAIWLSSRTGEVFAPYDGGIDLILATPARAIALRQVFPTDWLSRRADGL